MCITASNKNIIEFMIGEERVQADRKLLMSKSPFFKKIFSSDEHTGKTVVLHDTTATVFKSFVKLLEGSPDAINRNNVNELLVLAGHIESDFLMLKCVEFFANLSEKDSIFLSIQTLEKAVELKDASEKSFVRTNLAHIFHSSFIVRNKDRILSLSSKAKSFILELLIDEISTKVARDNKVDTKTKKLEQRCSILETQLRKALEDLKASKDTMKSARDAQADLGKLKKKQDQSEKKCKNQEEELEKLRKKLTAENKKNQMLQKELKESEKKMEESLLIVKSEKKQFEDSMKREKKMFEDSLKEIKQDASALRKLSEIESAEFMKALNNLKETIHQLQEENKAKSNVSQANAGTSTDDLVSSDSFTPEYKLNPKLKSIWSGIPSTSYYLEERTVYDRFEWKQKPVWTNGLFM